jgi:hypothetical protein
LPDESANGGDEWASIVADAETCRSLSPGERVAAPRDLLATVDAIWSSLTPEERERRKRIHDQVHASPDPWWTNIRPEAVPPL